MLFTTGQMRTAFGLSKQQWRSYRGALAPLTRDQGRAACFSATDLLATSVIHRLSTGLSIPLNIFTVVAEPLFQLLAACPWPQLERSILSIDVEQSCVELVDRDRELSSATVILLIELAPMIAALRRQLLAGVPDPQRDLAFPPMIAGARR
jgi:hypothetical protein